MHHKSTNMKYTTTDNGMESVFTDLKTKRMTEIKRTMIASLLIEQATELKAKRPTELGFEDLVDVVQAVVKNCSIPDVAGRSEQLLALAQYMCEHQNNLDGKTAKDYLKDFLSQ